MFILLRKNWIELNWIEFQTTSNTNAWRITLESMLYVDIKIRCHMKTLSTSWWSCLFTSRLIDWLIDNAAILDAGHLLIKNNWHYRSLSHVITPAILVYQNNEKAARCTKTILSVRLKLFSYSFMLSVISYLLLSRFLFGYNKLARLMVTWVKTLFCNRCEKKTYLELLLVSNVARIWHLVHVHSWFDHIPFCMQIHNSPFYLIL